MLESLQSGIVACDADGMLTLFNRAARGFHSLPELPLPPSQWAERFDLYQADGITPMATAEIPLFRAFQGETVRDAELVIAPKDGPARTLLASGQAIYSHTGEKLGAVVAMHDVTARREVERELARLAAIVESSEDAIIAATLDGTLVSWNAGAERLFGYPASEIISRHASVLVPPDEVSSIAGGMARLMRGEAMEPIEALRLRRDGTLVNVSLSFSPVRDAEGQVVGVSSIARDITARRQTEEALRRSEATLRAVLEGAPLVLYAADAAGTVTLSEGRGLAALGLAPGQVVGQSLFDFADDFVAQENLRRVLAGETVSYDSQAHGLSFHNELRPVPDGNGGVAGMIGVAFDVTERAASEERFRVLFEKSSNAHMLVGAEGIIDCNAAAVALLRCSDKSQLLSLHPSTFSPEFQPDGKRSDEKSDEMEALAREQGCHRFEWTHCRMDGDEFSTEITLTPVTLGNRPALLAVWHDLTERKKAEEAVRESEARLRSLSDAVFEGISVSQDGAVVDANPAFCRLFGYDSVAQVIGKTASELAAPQSRDLILRNHLGGEEAAYEARCRRRDGSTFHAEIRGQQVLWGGQPSRVTAVRDITERVLSEERFRVLFEKSSHAHLLFGPSGIIECNPAALTMMRCPDKAQLLGKQPALLAPERQPDGRLSSEKGEEMCAVAWKNGSHQFEWIRQAMDGNKFPVEVTLTAVTLNEQPVLLSVWHDLSERKRSEQQLKDYMVILEFQKSQLEMVNRELEALATTDGLTGLNNHRTFQQKLAEEHARSVRYRLPLSALMLDVDSFKSYNDAFGHPAGDAVLQQVAGVLSRTVRDTDIVARYGGEEFALILPQTDAAGAMIIAERLRTAVEACAWERRPVTVSVGTCTLSLNTPAPGDMIDCADKALYRSKESGRNRVTRGRPSPRRSPEAAPTAGTSLP